MRAPAKGQGNKIDPAKTDITAALSDALLQRILLAIPESARVPCSLVCHRWLRAVGKLQRSLRLLDWQFLESGRLVQRFPNLTDLDLTWACIRDVPRNNSILLAMPQLILPLHPYVTREDKTFSMEACIRSQQVSPEALDRGLAVLATGCPDLQRLRFVDVSNNHGPGGSFSEWEFVSANEKAGLQPVHMLRDVSGDGENKAGKDGEKARGDGGEMVVVRNGENAVRDESLDILDQAGTRVVKDDNADSGMKKAGPNTDAGVKNTVGSNLVDAVEGKNTSAPTKAGGESDGELRKKGGQQQGKGSNNQGEAGLVTLAKGCPTLQDLEVHQCTDETITSIVTCQNVQILRLVGTVPGFSNCSFTDVGLTILANRCRRLLRLELSGCEASFAGIAAIGQCCMMLEELTLSSTGFQEGWVAALGYFQSLITLRLESCKYIDRRPGPTEHIKSCQTLEKLQLVCCDLRDRSGLAALLTVCANTRELEYQDCWGLDDESFALAATCKKVRLLSLDGCSLVTAAGLETVAMACKELQRLRVVYCSNIRDSEISPDFGNVVVMLKEFRWRPDTKSLLSSTTAIAQTGRWFFKT
ncbi:unnamed protein product [Calypogeia fissa]